MRGTDPQIDFGKGAKGTVFGFQVIVHMMPEEQLLFVQHINDHLAPGGVAYTTVPNVNVVSPGVVPSRANCTQWGGHHLGSSAIY